jgi:hypothetical protein
MERSFIPRGRRRYFGRIHFATVQAHFQVQADGDGYRTETPGKDWGRPEHVRVEPKCGQPRARGEQAIGDSLHATYC